MDALGLTEQMSNYIIRPPRANYTVSQLGQPTFEYGKAAYERIDFTVPAQEHNPKLAGSIYSQKGKNSKIRPTVIYLHANSSSRVTAKNYLKHLIQHFDVVAFDFRGCGMSAGNYLTLGYLEKYDVKAVIQYVDANFGSRRYLLWGRSMGAVTALLYATQFQRNSQKVAALVLDSPFADLQKVIYFLKERRLPLLPGFLVGSMIESLEEHIKQKILEQYGSEFIIRKHKPINKVPKLRVPAFFIGSKSDELVQCKHIEDLYNSCFSRKELQILEGGHNQTRPQHLKLAVVQFLLASLNFKDQTSRRKIFDFKGQSFAEENNNISMEINAENKRLRSKSASNKNRIFRAQTQVDSKPLEEERMGQKKGTEKMYEKEMGVTHAQILHKVLPKNSVRRKSRIFGVEEQLQK